MTNEGVAIYMYFKYERRTTYYFLYDFLSYVDYHCSLRRVKKKEELVLGWNDEL